MSGWTTCHDHGVDYDVEDGCPVCASVKEIRLLRESNITLSRRLIGHQPHWTDPQIHYLFGKPLKEVAQILDAHDDAVRRSANTADAG